mmetsp:Transcript_121842/g.192997  ORF Transcript_121842/g.192997 Transcript_121842/m.192997 type:complete len:482 (-) Transcript_121842:462-1907(-)
MDQTSQSDQTRHTRGIFANLPSPGKPDLIASSRMTPTGNFDSLPSAMIQYDPTLGNFTSNTAAMESADALSHKIGNNRKEQTRPAPLVSDSDDDTDRKPTPTSTHEQNKEEWLLENRYCDLWPDEIWNFFVEFFDSEQFNFNSVAQYLGFEDESGKTEEGAKTSASAEKISARNYHHFPFFTLAHTIVAFSLWLVFSFQQEDKNVPWRMKRAGLDSLLPDKTDLRIGLECVDTRFQVWRWWTYQYTHIGITHVMMNSLLNLFLGLQIEGFHGTLRTVLMYNVGVLGGALSFFVSDVHHAAVGMSGGCYSLIGMHLGCLILNWSQRRRKYRRAKLFFLLLLAMIDIITANVAVTDSGDTTVSHSIHFGGYVGGLLIVVVIGRNLVVTRSEHVFIAVALFTGVSLVIFCLAWGMSWPPQTVFEQVRWCWTRQVNNQQLFGNLDWHCVRCGDQACIDEWSREKYIDLVSMASCEKRGGWLVTEP